MTGSFATRRERRLAETGAINLAASQRQPVAVKTVPVSSATASPVTLPGGIPAANPSDPKADPRSDPKSHPELGAGTGAKGSTTETTTTEQTTTESTKTGKADDPKLSPSIVRRSKTRRDTQAGERPGRGLAIGVRVVAGLIALAGIVLLTIGGLKATAWAPSEVVVGKLGTHSAKFVTSEIGALGLAGPRLQIDVSGSGSDPVFVGIGRASDVDAYLGTAATDRIVGLDKADEQLITKTIGADQGEVPDPAGADVWTVSALGQGSATLNWPDPSTGQWRLVIAGNGTKVAPQDVTFTWSGDKPANSAPVFIAIGVVLVVAGLMTLVVLANRSRVRGKA